MKRTRKTKEETSLDIWEAIKLINIGKADKLNNPECKLISIKNVCTQANVSRQTIYSYPEIKEYIDSFKRNKKEILVDDDKINCLENEIKNLKDYIVQIEKERDLALLEQHNVLEKLKKFENIKLIK